MLNTLSQELNSILAGTTAGSLLSDLGTRIYFPKGIIAQSAEAKKLGKTANATIGTALQNGKPIILDSVHKFAPELSAAELVSYAPTAGNPELRAQWKEKLIQKNPGLAEKSISLPVVVPGLTAGISFLSDLFVDEKHPLLAANPSWDNYALIVETRRNSELRQFNMFKDGGFDIDSFRKALADEAKSSGSVRVILNFPQNPSGYSPTKKEAKEIIEAVKAEAEKGTKIIVWDDDAYFGLNYEDDIYPQSLFAELCDIHENVLAVKIDGPTKEDFAWGFRNGFITFGGKGMTEAQYDALIKKLMGLIRSSVSCSTTPSQSIMLRALKEPGLNDEKLSYRKVLEGRYKLVRKFVDSHKSAKLTPLPFNSGYFMSFALNGIDAEEMRQRLLNEKGIGTIAIDPKTLRVAFSSLDEDKIGVVYSAIYEMAETF